MNQLSGERAGFSAGVCRGLRALLLPVLVVFAGCATGPNADPRDPLEPLNRGTYQFNRALDEGLVKPTVHVYKTVTPDLVRAGVRNFFSNLSDTWSLLNNLLQGKLEHSVDTFARLTLNTLVGFGGIFDVAGDLGVEQHREDFGQTMGWWGIPAGPYLVLPLLGPSDVRDATALVVDSVADPTGQISVVRYRNLMILLSLVDKREQLLRASELLDEAALDPYSFTRDFYLQLRRNDIYDGFPPDEGFEPKRESASPAAAPGS